MNAQLAMGRNSFKVTFPREDIADGVPDYVEITVEPNGSLTLRGFDGRLVVRSDCANKINVALEKILMSRSDENGWGGVVRFDPIPDEQHSAASEYYHQGIEPCECYGSRDCPHGEVCTAGTHEWYVTKDRKREVCAKCGAQRKWRMQKPVCTCGVDYEHAPYPCAVHGDNIEPKHKWTCENGEPCEWVSVPNSYGLQNAQQVVSFECIRCHAIRTENARRNPSKTETA